MAEASLMGGKSSGEEEQVEELSNSRGPKEL